MAHNLVALQETLEEFKTLEADGLLLRMEAREADIYGFSALELLTRARRVLCEKYDVELSEPILVEIFPQQKDFAVRTFGMLAAAGFLGVCFGNVITVNSPASQGETPANWQARLLLGRNQWQKAIAPLEKLLELCPGDIGPDNAYLLLASSHRELGEAEAERLVLNRLAVLDANALPAYLQLTELCREAEDWQGVAANAQRVLAVNPLLRAPTAAWPGLPR